MLEPCAAHLVPRADVLCLDCASWVQNATVGAVTLDLRARIGVGDGVLVGDWPKPVIVRQVDLAAVHSVQNYTGPSVTNTKLTLVPALAYREAGARAWASVGRSAARAPVVHQRSITSLLPPRRPQRGFAASSSAWLVRT